MWNPLALLNESNNQRSILFPPLHRGGRAGGKPGKNHAAGDGRPFPMILGKGGSAHPNAIRPPLVQWLVMATELCPIQLLTVASEFPASNSMEMVVLLKACTCT